MLSAPAAGFGRPEPARDAVVSRLPHQAEGIDLQHTACYTCTDWHACLVFATDAGVRLPLCESCLRWVIPLALAAS